MREALNAQLVQAGFRSLEEDWAPSWQMSAFRAREEIRRAPDERQPGRYPGEELPSNREAKSTCPGKVESCFGSGRLPLVGSEADEVQR
jgi:hypothetical protein